MGVITMRAPCGCGETIGSIVPRNGQNTVWCSGCGKYAGYNAPRTETGEKQRSVSTTHEAIKPKQKARIIERATARCELCGAGGNLHVGHLLSVDDGLALGMGLTDRDLNDDENLAAMCEECNLGAGRQSFAPRLYVALLMRRTRR